MEVPDETSQMLKAAADIVAKETGTPPEAAARAIRDEMRKKIQRRARQYLLLRQRKPEIVSLEYELRDHITRVSEALDISIELATSFVVVEHWLLQLELKRLKRTNMTEEQIQSLLGVNDPLPQDILDMFNDNVD